MDVVWGESAGVKGQLWVLYPLLFALQVRLRRRTFCWSTRPAARKICSADRGLCSCNSCDAISRTRVQCDCSGLVQLHLLTLVTLFRLELSRRLLGAAEKLNPAESASGRSSLGFNGFSFKNQPQFALSAGLPVLHRFKTDYVVNLRFLRMAGEFRRTVSNLLPHRGVT